MRAEKWQRVPLENGLASRSLEIAELVRQAMLIHEDLATEFLASILDGQVDPEKPFHLYDPTLSDDEDEAWLCILRNEAGATEPPLPQAGHRA